MTAVLVRAVAGLPARVGVLHARVGVANAIAPVPARQQRLARLLARHLRRTARDGDGNVVAWADALHWGLAWWTGAVVALVTDRMPT